MTNCGLVIFCFLSFVGLDFGSGKMIIIIFCWANRIFFLDYFNTYHNDRILYVLGQSGEDVTFLVLVDKGASLEAVNAFGDGLAAFQVNWNNFL